MNQMPARELFALSKTLRGEDSRRSRRRLRRDSLPDDARRLRPILNAVCRLRRIKPERLLSREKTSHVAFNREMAMYVARAVTRLSYTIIGDFFLRDHSTVIHDCNVMARQMKARPALAAEVNRLIRDLSTPALEEEAAA